MAPITNAALTLNQRATSDPKFDAIAKRILTSMKLSAEKAIAHAADPEKYRISSRPTTGEQIILGLFKKYPLQRQQTAITNVMRSIRRSTVQRTQEYGDFAKVDLQSQFSVEQQAKSFEFPPALAVPSGYLKHKALVENRFILGKGVAEVKTSVQVEKAIRTIRKAEDTVHVDWSNLLEALAERNGLDVNNLTDIDKKYLLLGGKDGFLGSPNGAEQPAESGPGRYRFYQGGSIFWSPSTGAHEIHGAILAQYCNLGAKGGVLGYPLTDETKTPDGVGRFNHFENGSIYWSPSTGAHEVHGAIRNKWAALGWELSYLGYPTTDETTAPDGIGCFSHFQNGSIYWGPEFGACAVHKHIRDLWATEGWEVGYLGYPLSDTAGTAATKLSNDFQGGRITWTSAAGGSIEKPLSKIEFRIHKLTCKKLTDGPGADDMKWGGVKIDYLGNVTKVGETSEMEFEDDGDSEFFSPPRIFCEFPILKAGWPKTFSVMIMLSEGDHGGFNDVLQEFVLWVRGLVDAYLDDAAAAAGTAIGAWIGGILGTEAPVLGTIIGALVGAILGWLVGQFFAWINEIFEDDYFLPIAISQTIASVHRRWNGNTDTPDVVPWWEDHGGRYELTGDWKLA